jgi:hypothetical protein
MIQAPAFCFHVSARRFTCDFTQMQCTDLYTADMALCCTIDDACLSHQPADCHVGLFVLYIVNVFVCIRFAKMGCLLMRRKTCQHLNYFTPSRRDDFTYQLLETSETANITKLPHAYITHLQPHTVTQQTKPFSPSHSASHNARVHPSTPQPLRCSTIPKALRIATPNCSGTSLELMEQRQRSGSVA